MLRKISSLAIFSVALVSFVKAQDSTKKSALNITGSVDAYYRYNFQNVKDTNYATTNNYTSFTNSHNSFELGMASIKAEYTTGKVTGVVDLGFGRRAEEFSYNEAATGLGTAIKQAYISVAATDKLKFTMGKWATHVGYELVDAYLNRNYSMSYMFSYGPFFHTGVKAEYTAGNFGFMLGVANPTDFVTASFAKKWILGQITASGADGKFKAYLNYQGGKTNDIWENKIHQVDLVVTGTLSDKFSVGYNGTMQSVKTKAKSSGDSWWGSAVYLNVDPSKVFGVSTLISDKSRVIKGGSWNDRPYWLSPGTRRYLEEDQGSSTVGFRCAMDRLGSPEGNGRKTGINYPTRRQNTRKR